ncbi:MAG: hypothetical protein V7646_3260, partial [Pseudonocardia sp.]
MTLRFGVNGAYGQEPERAAARSIVTGVGSPQRHPNRGDDLPATDSEQYVSVSLTKGGNVSLSKEAPGLTAVIVGLG